MSGVIQKYKVSKNLFVTSNAVADKYIDAYGNEQNGIYDGYSFSYVYIPVNPDTTYTFHYDWFAPSAGSSDVIRRTHRRIIAYDSNGSFITQIIDVQPSNVDNTGEGTFTTPANCYRISINYINNEQPCYDYNLMLNTGETARPYEPFETENLFDYSNLETGAIDPSDGTNMVNNTQRRTKGYISVNPNTSYILSNIDSDVRVHQYGSDNSYKGSAIYSNTFTTDIDTYKIRIAGASSNFKENTMLNIGSTPLPYTPYGTIWKDIPYTRLETATDTITTLPKTIYTDTTSIPSANLLNTTDVQQTFPAGTYYIYSDSSNADIEYFDNVGEHPSSHIMHNHGVIFTATTSLVIRVFSADKLPLCMVAKSSEAVPFTPYVGDYTIKGNMSQSGTPTPTTPITPQECGERTSNLFDKNNYIDATGYYVGNREVITAADAVVSMLIPIEGGKTYTLKTTGYTNRFACGFVKTLTVTPQEPVYQYSVGLSSLLYRGTADADVVGLFVYYAKTNENNAPTAAQIEELINNMQLVEGNYTTETMPPYEPYGYKIPISSGGVTTNIYMGSTQTTRQIKKYTFTGEETVSNCVATTDGQNYCVVFRFDDIGMSDIIDYEKTMANISYPHYVSSHFVNKTDNYDNYKTIYDGQVGANDYGSTGQAKNRYIIFCVAGLTTAADYSAWFAQQYANGTPVEVYYILENEITGIVNEPIRKIDDYVDSITNPVQIPITSGGQTFDVSTTLKPSEVDLTYHGWHEHEAKKYNRTENLFNYTKQDTANGYVDNAYINAYGATVTENVYAVSEYIEITGQYVSLSVPISLNSLAVCFYNSEKHFISGAAYSLRSAVTEQIPQNAVYIRFTIVKQYASTTMVNLGNTLEPYQPYLDWK